MEGYLGAGVALGVGAVLGGGLGAFTSLPLLILLAIFVGPSAVAAFSKTVEFCQSMNKDKKQGKIDGYNAKYDDKKGKSAESRNADYANLVDTYYDLATEFYEWGWGNSFHFADRRKGETFHQSILRHEYYLAGRLGVKKDAVLLDCGCGIGGPARNIARFTGANIKAVTINQFQVNRGNTLSVKEGIRDKVELIQADFMKLPMKDNTFDGVYAIESTCHAPDRSKVYGEIFRVLKPGCVFACYEWCLTDKYDPKNPEHQKIKRDIELGDGLPDLAHTDVCTKALQKVGFEIMETRDCMTDGHLEGGEEWYVPLTPSWNPTKWPRFQFNPVMFNAMPVIMGGFESLGLVPKGTVETQKMLQAAGVGLPAGGITGVFTPAWLMVARKPL